MIIDTHAHLNDDRLIGSVEQIIADMDIDNLSAIISVGYDRESSITNLQLANKYDNVYCALGIHPHDSRLATQEDYKFFADNASNKKVVAIGEIGLDYYYDYSPRDIQAKVMIEQMNLAFDLKLPIIIHLRDAYEPMLKILNDNRHLLKNGGVLHCYSGSLEMLNKYLAFGLYISYGGAITFNNFGKAEVIKATPLDRLLIETDCPYMTPVPNRGKTNYPKHTSLVAQKLAEWLPLTTPELEELTSSNAKKLFSKLR